MRTRLRLRLAALSCATVVAWCLSVAAARAKAVISEVMWMGSDLSTADEWVEIAGAGEEMALGGWTLTSVNSSGKEVVLHTFSANDVLQDGDIAIISHYPAGSSRLLAEPHFVDAAVSLPNTKLLLRLRDGSGAVMDEVDDGVGEPFAGTNVSGGLKASMERKDLLRPGNQKDNWQTAGTFIGFDPGFPVVGSPGFANGTGEASGSSSSQAVSSSSSATSESNNSSSNSSESIHQPSSSSSQSSQASRPTSSESSASSSTPSSLPPTIRITEVLPDPEGSDDAEWIELHNESAEPVDLAGWKIERGTGKHTFVGGMLLEPDAYRVFRKRDTGLTLPADGGTLLLYAGTILVDQLTYPATPEGVSYGRKAGKEGWTQHFCTPTEAAANVEKSWSPFLIIQSGKVRDEGSVTVNLEVSIPWGFAGTAECFFDFGDGEWRDGCNPGSHSYTTVGRYIVRADMKNYCGNTVTQTLTIEVYDDQASSSSVPLNVAFVEEQKIYSSSSSSFSSSQCVSMEVADLRITEFLPNPAGSDEGTEWIELANDGPEMQFLCGWRLMTDSSKKPFSLDGVSIPAGGVVLLSSTRTGLSLRNTKDTVRLSFIDADSMENVVQEVSYENAKDGQSSMGQEDGAFVWTKEMTPGERNGEANGETKISDQKISQTVGIKQKTTPKKTVKKTTKKSTKKSTATAKKAAGQESAVEEGVKDDLLASVESVEQIPSSQYSIVLLSTILVIISILVVKYWLGHRKRLNIDKIERNI